MVEKDQKLVNFNWILTRSFKQSSNASSDLQIGQISTFNLDGLKSKSSTAQFVGPNGLNLQFIPWLVANQRGSE